MLMNTLVKKSSSDIKKHFLHRMMFFFKSKPVVFIRTSLLIIILKAIFIFFLFYIFFFIIHIYSVKMVHDRYNNFNKYRFNSQYLHYVILYFYLTNNILSKTKYK